MPGVTQIQVQASIQFDDGNVITLQSPSWKKDIRQGDYFPDDQIAEIITLTGECIAELLKEKTSRKLYTELKAKKLYGKQPPFWRKPRPDEPFSSN